MNTQLIKGFVVGSSWPVFVLFFMGFYSYSYNKKINENNCLSKYLNIDPYYFYTIMAPLYLGTMTSIAIYLHQNYDISIEKSFLIISLISAFITSLAITICSIYNFSDERLKEQYLRLIIYHLIIYNLVILTIYKLIS
jgi:signal transduction histidine kinase